MKLIEVVVLTGIQCVSPVQTAPAVTEAQKVWCAVIVQGDSDTSAIAVTPREQMLDPAVKSAISRMQLAFNPGAKPAPQQPGGLTVAEVPVPAPPAALRVRPSASAAAMTQIAKSPDALPPAETPVPVADTGSDGDAGSAPEPAAARTPEAKTAALDPVAPEPPAPAKKKTSPKKRSDVCRNGTRAVWYTNKDGRRKYRCSRPDDTAIVY